MAFDPSKYLVIGISSRALFDLREEDEIYRMKGLTKYRDHQIEHEKDILKPGPGFPLIKAILEINQFERLRRKAEVIIMSHNSAETSLRIFNSIEHYNLNITRAALVGDAQLAPYFQAFSVDLFLSLYERDVQDAVNGGIASAILYDRPTNVNDFVGQIRIAFDGDAVIFSDESERIYKEQGIEAFLSFEKENARKPLPEGPFAKLLKAISFIQSEFTPEESPIRTALVTARNSPSHERVIRTLRTWGVHIDEAFFLGGIAKDEILRAFKPHIFFDDQVVHCDSASTIVPTGRVPYIVGPPVPPRINLIAASTNQHQ
jgi:5'-nucleotidase